MTTRYCPRSNPWSIVRMIGLATFYVFLAGCSATGGINPESSQFAQPSVVYRTGDKIEITQYFGPDRREGFDEKKAMELLGKECGGAFHVVNRTNTADGHTYVDAVCDR
jgi:hypothetical protein